MAYIDRVHPDVLTLTELLRAEWPAARERIRLSGHPTNEGDADPEPDPPDPTPDPEPDPDPDDPPTPAAEPDWKQMARKHEREAKAARKRETDLAAKLKEREDADKSDHDKAIEQARAEARTVALGEAEKDRRADRLELAVTRIAVGKGVTVGEGDKAKTAKFADADDVQMWLERQIERGDIDAEDIFGDDGKVDQDALAGVLTDLATSKPSWLAGGSSEPNGGGRIPAGDADAGKGKATRTDLESMSPDDHYKAIRGGRR